MKVKLMSAALVGAALLIAGCEPWMEEPDYYPPAPPSGVRTSTGDNFIELFWNQNGEPDLAGYYVYVSGSYGGRYELVGTTTDEYFVDSDARNGSTYYYAVAAFDYAGNISELSRDVAYDIPRPEGYNVILYDVRIAPGSAGYDFSRYAVVAFNDTYVDMYFENYNGSLYMVVNEDTDIQDMGPTRSILDITMAPAAGWSISKDVRLEAGHTYVVWTWDDHYAKFRVTGIAPGRVVFDWAYQLVESNPLLKRAPVEERSPILPRKRQ